MGDNNINLKVIEVTSPWDFLAVELVGGDDSQLSAEAYDFRKFHMDMTEYLEAMLEQGAGPYRPSVGEMCALKRMEDNEWHRVTVQSLQTSSSSHQSRCYAVDDGEEYLCSLNRLCRLPTRFRDHPHRVKRYSLWGVQPSTLTLEQADTDIGLAVEKRPSNKWDTSACNEMRRLVTESKGCQAEVIERMTDGRLSVRLYFMTDEGLLCFNEYLVDEKYGEYLEQGHISSPHYPGKPITETSPLARLPELIPCGDSPEHREVKESLSDKVKNFFKIYEEVLSSPEKTGHVAPPVLDVSPQEVVYSTDIEEELLSPGSTAPLKTSQGDPAARKRKSSSGIIKTPLKSSAKTTSQDDGALKDKDRKNGIFLKGKFSSMGVRDAEHTSLTFAGGGRGLSVGRGVLFELYSRSSPGPAKAHRQHEHKGMELTACVPFSSPSKAAPANHSTEGSPPPLIASDSPPPGETKHAEPAADTVNMYSSASEEVLLRLSGNKAQSGNTVLTSKHMEKVWSDGSSVKSSSGDKATGAADQKGLNESSAAVLSSALSDDGSLSSSSMGGRRARYRGSLDPMVEKKSKEKCEETRFSMDKYMAKAKGDKILSKLREQSGKQLLGEDLPSLFRQDQPVPYPLFGVLAHGKSVPSFQYELSIFHDSVIKTLQNHFNIENSVGMDGIVWPALMTNRHVVGVSPMSHDRSMAYIPPILTQLLDKTKYLELPPGKGPLCIIVVSSWRKARNVYENIEVFTGSSSKTMKQLKCIVLYAGGTEDTHTTSFDLLKGCEILVTTPCSLLRMLEEENTSLKRLCHLILDDADVLAEKFSREVEEIVLMYNLVIQDRQNEELVPKQIAFFSCRWTEGLDKFHQRYTKTAIVVLSSRVEAAVYGGVKQVLIPAQSSNQLTKFCGLVDSLVTAPERAIVFTEHSKQARELYQAVKSRGIYCLLMHDKLEPNSIEEARIQWLQATRSKQLVVMVCTDKCYQDLAVTNATAVIHYNLPDSKTRFGNRMACMIDYFLDRTDPKASQTREHEPVSHILLSTDSAPKLQSLKGVLERCQSECPPGFSEFLRKYRNNLDNDAEKRLCPLLKSFGKCGKEYQCPDRHLLMPDVDLKTGMVTVNHLPASGEIRVRVVNVKTASCYYVHLLEHCSLPERVRTDLRSTYQLLVLDMTFYFCKEKNHQPFMLSEDSCNYTDILCAFRDKDGAFYRAKVVRTRKGRNMRECEVWLVDAGRYETGTIDQLLELPDSLAKVPHQAVEVYICRIQPADKDFEWTDMANFFAFKLLDGKELLGSIVLRLGNTLWLDPLVHQVKLRSVGLANDMVIRQTLLANNYAVANPDHIQLLYELCRGKTEIPERIMRKYFDYCLEIELMQETLTNKAVYHEINVAYMESPGLFYIQKFDTIEELQSLESAIKDWVCDTDGGEGDGEKADTQMELKAGSVCLAKFSHDQWYRGKIISEQQEGQWDIFSLDYGEREWVAIDLVRPLPRQLAQLPCQAIECSLAHVQPWEKNNASPPTASDEWNSSALDVLCDLTLYVDEMKKCLFAKVVDHQDSQYTMGQQLVVELTNTEGGHQVLLGQELVDRHVARPVSTTEGASENLKPLFCKPALRNQMFFNPWDKIPFLCANMYCCEDKDDTETMHHANELKELLSCRTDCWDSALEERGVLSTLIKTVGHLTSDQAHGVLISALTDCCLDSHRFSEAALRNDVLLLLHLCLEQVSRPAIQLQAAEALKKLLGQSSFLQAIRSSSIMKTFTFFFNTHEKDPLDLKLVQCLCNVVSQMIMNSEILECDDLVSPETLQVVLTCLQACPTDLDCEPWLEVLAAAAHHNSTHSYLIKDKVISLLISYLEEKDSSLCVFYLLTICQCLATASKKHKLTLLEHKLVIILTSLLNRDVLVSPSLELCQDLQVAMTPQLPQQEVLAGVPAVLTSGGDGHGTSTCPEVKWSENSFCVILTVIIPEASQEDFHLHRDRLVVRSVHDGVSYELDWELYDCILPDESRVKPYPSHTKLALRKETKGRWGRVLRQKVKPTCLTTDFSKLVNSDEEEEVDDPNDMTRLSQAKNRFKNVPRDQQYRILPADEDSEDDEDNFSDHSDHHYGQGHIDFEALFKGLKR